MHIALVIRGLFEKSDSVGYDCVFQYCCLRKSVAAENHNSTVQIFAEKFDADLHTGIPIRPISEFYKLSIDPQKKLTIIYHYCDGWPEIDNLLMKSRRHNVVVRWHNNTPPWFFVKDEPHFAQSTLRGYEQVVSFLKNDAISFWANSQFSKRQLEALGAHEDRISVVYPASRYLEKATPERNERPIAATQSRLLRLLFVSRVVAHKGHRHVVAVAGIVRGLLGFPVQVDFIGRSHPSSTKYVNQLHSLAAQWDVKLVMHGEVTEDELLTAYRSSDVFVCLSEHEGFGLPIFEAMRCGVPVVAWANTALAELLAGHPLALKKFSPQLFAEAVVSLVNTEYKSNVIEKQYSMLSQYTFDVVRSQIEHALRTSSSLNQIETLNSAALHQSMSAPFESGENLMSLYDIQNYRYFLSQILGMDPELTWLSRMTVGKAGERQGDFIRVKRGKAGHFAFGPYFSLPAGSYRLRVELKARSRLRERLRALCSRRNTEVRCEIVSGDFSLGKKVYSGWDMLRGTKYIDFTVGDPEGDGKLDAIEFRFWTRGRIGAKLKSISLERIVSPAEFPITEIISHSKDASVSRDFEQAPQTYHDDIEVEIRSGPEEIAASITTH